MALLEATNKNTQEEAARPPARQSMPVMAGGILARLGLLLALGLLALPFYSRILAVAGVYLDRPTLLLWPEVGVTVLYALAAALVLRSQAAYARWLHWAELGLILALGLAARSLLYAAPPTLSHDAYRYVWDAHLLTHGLSPYTHTPLDPTVQPWQDQAIWPNLRYRQSPTIYPPGAQMLFLLLYLLKPLSIGALKAGIAVCDGLVALLTLLLLRRHRLDARRVLIYWWSPIPIMEFAFSAHVDAAAIVWTLAALLVFGARWRGARGAAGVLLGMGTLTKLYPALFALVLLRQKARKRLILWDAWPVALGLAGTVVLGYLVFWPFGAQSGGYLSTYVEQGTIDRGVALNLLTFLVNLLGGTQTLIIVVQGLALALACAAIGWLWWRTGWRPESGVLALNVTWILFATHLLTWYLAILLPLLALYLRWPSLHLGGSAGESPQEPSGQPPTLFGRFATPTLGIWVFTLAMPFTYVFFAPGAFYPSLFQGMFLLSFAIAALPLLTRQGRAALRSVLRTCLPVVPRFASLSATRAAAPSV
jgi:hypothetical protein